MGDPRNWTARKVGQVRRENSARDRQRLVEVTLYHHSAAALAGQAGPNFMVLHPCDTFRVFRLRVTATCMGCMAQREVTAAAFDDTPWAHRHWPAVMDKLICERCESCPRELRFSDLRGGDVGVISLDAQTTLRVATATSGVTRPVLSRVEVDPFVQHDDGSVA